MNEGYTLVVCEKPDAARKVAEALSEGEVSDAAVAGVRVFKFRRDGEDFVVCAAQGHIYAISDPLVERSVYPVFDTEWFDYGSVDRNAKNAARRIRAFRELAKGAGRFVNACDYDVEGGTIGFNILRYACGGKERSAARARFSTLTRDDLIEAFGSAREEGSGMADAGRARHLVDFAWGVNLSRALSQSAFRFGLKHGTVSIGRVQGPTIGFVVDREREIRGFVSRPFWTVAGVFEKSGTRLVAAHVTERFQRRVDAERMKECTGRWGTASSVSRGISELRPPPPFNIGDLQKEAYRVFGYSPSRTLQIAERLYLDAMISYPRTDSQKLPKSIDCEKILRRLASVAEYSRHAKTLLGRVLKPTQGEKGDSAHPAIHPTGERPTRPLDRQQTRVFDLIVRRFLSVFAPSASRESVSVRIVVGEHLFKLAGRRTFASGWLDYYAPYVGWPDVNLPDITEGEKLKLLKVELEEKFEQRSVGYSQSSLLERMEKESVGTKATRAEVISTLVDRGYVAGEPLVASALGFSVVETMERYAQDILSTSLTRSIEERLAVIEKGTGNSKELVRETVRAISNQLVELNSHEEVIGREISSAMATAVAARYSIGVCPVCKTGSLRIVHSKRTNKRFVGCSNYSDGCRASAPLPQRGTLKAARKPCQRCSWPVVYVTTRRLPWRLCVNPRCPSKAGRQT